MPENQESPSLQAVIDSFRQSEQDLGHIAESFHDLKGSTEALESAQEALQRTSNNLSAFVEALRALSGRLGLATAAIEKTDPAEVNRQLASLASLAEGTKGRLEEVVSALQTIHKDQQHLRKSIEHKIKVLMFLGIGIGGVVILGVAYVATKAG